MTIPYYQDEFVTLYLGDARDIVPTLEPPTFDVVLTDPPYSSGGFTRGDRNLKTSAKYVMGSSGADHPEFAGDNRDQRLFLLWCDLWMRDCLRVTTETGVLASFIDWRQLPTLVDAAQVAGWVYRGICPWDKTEGSRPQKGWFRAQAEYLVLASKGPLEVDVTGVCSPGVFRHAVNSSEKLHITGKPLPLMRDIIQTSPKFRRILDPFCGSGSTLLAAADLGRSAVGIEITEENCEIAARRLEARTGNLFGPHPDAQLDLIKKDAP